MYEWLAFAVNAAAGDAADDEIMIAGFAPAGHFARQMGQGGGQNGHPGRVIHD